MNTKVNKAYFLIPLLYLAVIIFLLYMQFSGSNSFDVEVSGITISGEKQSGAPGRDDTITELSIRISGLHFSFGEENPAMVFSQDGLIHALIPEDFRVTASGIDIRLSKGLFVSFYRIQNDNDSLHIAVTADDPESIKYIHLPVSGEQSQLIPTEGAPVISVKSESLGNFFLMLPESGSFDEQSASIVIYPETEGASELVLERTAGSGIDAFTYWMSGDAELISEKELAVKINSYIADAAGSIIGSRYNPTRGTWTMGTGVSGFDENALVMAAVENIGKSSYKNTMAQLNKAAASHSRDLSIFSASLFGNIVNEGWDYEKNIQAKAVELTRKSRNADYSIFTDDDLIAAVLTEESDELIKQISAMIGSAADADISVSDALAMLSFYSEITETYPEITSKFSAIRELIEPIILPAVKVLGGRLYLAGSGETADINQTLTAGLLLMNSINIGVNENYSTIGRELTHSVMLLADNTGLLPETVTAQEGGEIFTEGVITPETVYSMLTDNPYYPTADYFYNETGEKISVLNQTERFNIEKTDFGYRMTFDFPAGQTHSFAVRNIAPFYQMHLLGYRWNPDHRFLTYSSGWWYDKQHNTLFVKVKHRMKTEEVLIYTDTPPAPPAAAEPDAATDDTAAENVSSGQNGGL